MGHGSLPWDMWREGCWKAEPGADEHGASDDACSYSPWPLHFQHAHARAHGSTRLHHWHAPAPGWRPGRLPGGQAHLTIAISESAAASARCGGATAPPRAARRALSRRATQARRGAQPAGALPPAWRAPVVRWDKGIMGWHHGMAVGRAVSARLATRAGRASRRGGRGERLAGRLLRHHHHHHHHASLLKLSTKQVSVSATDGFHMPIIMPD